MVNKDQTKAPQNVYEYTWLCDITMKSAVKYTSKEFFDIFQICDMFNVQSRFLDSYLKSDIKFSFNDSCQCMYKSFVFRAIKLPSLYTVISLRVL